MRRCGVGKGGHGHLLRLAGLDVDSISDQLADTAVGLSLYAKGQGDGIRLAVEALQQSGLFEPPASAKDAMETLSRTIGSSPAIAEFVRRNQEQELAASREAMRWLSESSPLRRAAALHLSVSTDHPTESPSRSDD